MIQSEGVTYEHISHTREAGHTIVAITYFHDTEDMIFYGNDSGKMRHDIHRYYSEGRQPERVTLGVILDA